MRKRALRGGLLAGLSVLLLGGPLARESQGSGVDFSALERRLAPAVVAIETRTSRGSGFLVDEAGVVVTACHVVNTDLEGRLIEGRFRRVARVFFADDPRPYLAEVRNACRIIGPTEQSGAMQAAARDDVAILQLLGYLDEAERFVPLTSPTGLTRLWLAREAPAIGEPVFVAGFGGPFTEFAFQEGALAGSVALISATLDQLETGLDVYFSDLVILEEGFGLFDSLVGLVITDLVEDGPAARAGVRLGDVLVALEGESFTLIEGLELLANLKQDQPLNLTVEHTDGTREDLTVTIGTFALSRAVRFVENLLCFERATEELTAEDLRRARVLDLTLARHTLARAVAWAADCPLVLAVTLDFSGFFPQFTFVGRVTQVGPQTLEVEELNRFALDPLEGGRLVPEGGTGRLEESRFPRITALSGPGFSGAPVFNVWGQVVGLVDFGFSDLAPGYVVPLERLRAQLEAFLDRP